MTEKMTKAQQDRRIDELKQELEDRLAALPPEKRQEFQRQWDRSEVEIERDREREAYRRRMGGSVPVRPPAEPTTAKFISDYHRFRETHGPELWCNKYGQYLCADGCRLSHCREFQYEPPAGSYERLHAKVAYWRQTLEHLLDEFDAVKRSFLDEANWAARYSNMHPPDAAEAREHLTKLKAKQHEAQQQIAKAEAELQQTPEAKAIRERQEREDAKSNRAVAVGREINAMT